MSKEIIPSREILICDRCGGKGERESPSSAFQYGGTHLKGERWGVFLGGDVGGSRCSIDLCAGCTQDFEYWLKDGLSNKGDRNNE